MWALNLDHDYCRFTNYHCLKLPRQQGHSNDYEDILLICINFNYRFLLTTRMWLVNLAIYGINVSKL